MPVKFRREVGELNKVTLRSVLDFEVTADILNRFLPRDGEGTMVSLLSRNHF